MNNIEACRVCLATEVKLYGLEEHPLETYFEPILGLNPLCLVELPMYACYECAAFIKKYYFFREKCLRGQAVFYDILQKHGEISLNQIKQVDRWQLNLKSNIIIHKTQQITVSNDTDNDCESEVKTEYKTESHDTVENTQSDTGPIHDNLNLDVKCIKIEDDFLDIASLIQPSSDDDEPLSLHKTNKEKNKKKVKKGGRKIKNDAETIEVSVPEEQPDNLNGTDVVPAERPLSQPKPRRGRPKKAPAKKEQPKPKSRRTDNTGGVTADEADLEEYVDIVQLSVKEQIEEIKKRQESSNYLNASFKCDLCYKGFIDTSAWKHHVSKHAISAGDVECGVCKFRFKTKRALQKHASNHEKKYACKSCPYVSKTTTQAKQHQRWHKGVTYKCQYCDEISTKWTSYLSHVRIKHPSEFICGVCGYSFVSKLGLTMHKTMMHKDVVEKKDPGEDSKEAGPYCAQCDVQFISVEAWKRHMVTSVKHTQNDHFSNGCRVCGESFKSPEELRVHHRKEHARKRPKNYGKKPSNMVWPSKCEHCEEEIPNAREYWTHFRRVHPDKKYPIQKSYICEICGKSFRGNAFLTYHKRTHFEERAYKCNQCPKAFFNRTNLQMHEKTHSDNRPYPCSVCFKAFKCKGALDRHFRSHTGVKPYECGYCGKAFGQSNSCKLHVRTVHLKQPAPYVSRSRMERRRAMGKESQEPYLNRDTGKAAEMF